jgi:TolB-like protein/Tfp pilus assembly protein PilF
VLAADVAGYSRLMEEDEDRTLGRLRQIRREIADPKITASGGRIVKNTGDGLLVEFASVVDALRCAVDMQRAIADGNATTPPARRVEFRMGLNLGDIIVDDHDIFGDGVNIAARLEALAEPGGLCISGAVRDHTHDRLPYVFEDRGEQQVKNLVRPLHVYAMSPQAIGAAEVVDPPAPSASRHSHATRYRRAAQAMAIAAAIVAIGGLWWRFGDALTKATGTLPATAAPVAGLIRGPGPSASGVPRLSIIVLPFENLSHNPDQDYFADAITEDLTTDLSRIAGSFVIARNTAFTYKGIPVDVKQLGRDLGVHYVLEGSVRRLGDQVQVNVQLIDTGSGAHVWADRFETDRRNLTEAQREITGRLARTLNLELVQAVGRKIEEEGAVNPDAQDLVMRGWALYQRAQAAESREAAKKAFEQALTIDPKSYDAKLGIASVLVIKLAGGTSKLPENDEAQAEHLLNELLEHDPNRSQLHATIALLRRVQNRLPESRFELQRAIELDPNNAIAYGQLGVTLIYLGEPAAAIPLEEKRIRLNPNDPNIALAYWSLGLSHLLLGHYDAAIDWLTKAAAANPRVYYFYLDLAAALALRGDVNAGQVALAEALHLKPDINSISRQHARWAYTNNPAYRVLAEKTVDLGLRQAGFPEE